MADEDQPTSSDREQIIALADGGRFPGRIHVFAPGDFRAAKRRC
jgi:hypothetical protein